MANQLEFDFGVAVFSDYDDDGHLQIQHDAAGLDDKAGAVPAECILPGGFMHRPLDPDKDGEGTPTTGAGLLMWMHGDTRHAMPLNDDVRTVSKLPKLRKGGSGIYGGAGEYRTYVMVDGQDPTGAVQPGSLFVSTPYAKDGAKKSHLFSMLVRDKGKEAIILTHGEGHGFLATAGGTRAAMIKNAAGDASVAVSDKGVAIAGKTKVIGPLTVGDQNAAEPVVLALKLIEYLTALEARIAGGTGVLPATMPIAVVAAEMTTKFLKGS